MTQKPIALVYDLDGVVIDSRERIAKYIDQDAENRGDTKSLIESLKRFEYTTEGDLPIHEGIALVSSLIAHCTTKAQKSGVHCTPFALTSRGIGGQQPTIHWLGKHTPWSISQDTLLMRPADQYATSSVEYKQERILKLMEAYEIAYAIDDHPFICDMYRSLGIPTIQFLMSQYDCTSASGVLPAAAQEDSSVFAQLFDKQSASGCAKKQVVAGTFVGGRLVSTPNLCEFAGDVCPRLKMKSGEGYDLCHAHHAEARLAAVLTERGQRSDGVAYVAGHYYACEPCASALKKIGVTEIRIRENL